jgi:hypothetical protein
LLRFFKKIHHKIIIQENIHTYNKKLSWAQQIYKWFLIKS